MQLQRLPNIGEQDHLLAVELEEEFLSASPVADILQKTTFNQIAIHSAVHV
jgi:hypothetical protein